MRRWIFALVGAVLFEAATFLCGLILYPNGLDWLTMQQFAFGLVVFGTTTGALLGLVAAWVSGTSVTRRTRFLVVGTVVGVHVGPPTMRSEASTTGPAGAVISCTARTWEHLA